MSNQPVPVFKISLTNATLLASFYLLVAALVELTRRLWNPRWIERVSLSMEAFPARTLEVFGLFEPLREAWVKGRLSQLQVRFIYSLTTVVVIFVLGASVGVAMWGVATAARRFSRQKQD
jgi:hypothetical protein